MHPQNPENISPQLLGPEQLPEATTVTFRELQANPEELFQRGNVITGIKNGRDLDGLEALAAKWVNPGYYPSPEREIVREPLSNILRPPKSTAELRNGVAVVGYSGLTVATELWSRGKLAGGRACQVQYSYDGRMNPRYAATRQANVLRSITNLESTPDLMKTLEEINSQSAHEARELAANGLRRVILSGLPTLGKR